MENIIQDRLY